MSSLRILSAALVLAFASVTGAAASEDAATVGTLDLQGRGGIEVTGQVVFEDIMIGTSFPLPSVVTTTSTGAANLSMVGDTSVVSVAVPASFSMQQAGGDERLTVVTALDGGQAQVIGLASLMGHGEYLSVDIGGEISVKAQDLAPGEYRGLLVVVAQYN